MWDTQDQCVKDNVVIRPDVDTSVLTVQQLGLTRLNGPCYIDYCNENGRLKTFSNGSKITKREAEVLAAKGCFEDAGNPGRIICFWCKRNAHVESESMSEMDRKHEESGCAFFSLYLSCVGNSETDGQQQTVGTNTSMRLNCKFLLCDCKHTWFSDFDRFPECFMSQSSAPGTLCCPLCQKIITMVHLRRHTI